jgi:hypothetical protein
MRVGIDGKRAVGPIIPRRLASAQKCVCNASGARRCKWCSGPKYRGWSHIRGQKRHYSRLAETENCVLANGIDKQPEGGVALMSPFPVRGEAVAGRLSSAVHLMTPCLLANISS